MHPCEPKLETLKEIRKTLYSSPSTEENLKKIHALEVQINRIEKENKEVKAQETTETKETKATENKGE